MQNFKSFSLPQLTFITFCPKENINIYSNSTKQILINFPKIISAQNMLQHNVLQLYEINDKIQQRQLISINAINKFPQYANTLRYIFIFSSLSKYALY